MKKLLALQILMSNICAMDQPIQQPKLCRLDISWGEIVKIGRELHEMHGDKLDIHELILAELKNTEPLSREEMTVIKQEAIPKRSSNEKNNGGIKSACSKLFSIRKISSSPAEHKGGKH